MFPDANVYSRCTWDYPTWHCCTRARQAQDTTGGWPGFFHQHDHHCHYHPILFFILVSIVCCNITIISAIAGQGGGSGSSLMPLLCTTGRVTIISLIPNITVVVVNIISAVPHDLTALLRSTMFYQTGSMLILSWTQNRWTIWDTHMIIGSFFDEKNWIWIYFLI